MEDTIPPKNPGNLQDYEKACREFTWASVDKEFDWSNGGIYNVAHEAVDRHAQNWRRNKIALYSITADNDVRKYTFGEMSELTNKLASGLVKLGAEKGDRVFVFLDRTSELYISMVGIAKMGAIAGPLFSALGPEAVKDRALDCGAKYVITSPYLYKRLEPIRDDLVDVQKYIIVGDNAGLGDNTVKFDDILASGDPNYQVESMNPSDPYIIIYTSGSTGKPKGVMHGHKAMVQQLFTSKNVLDLKEEDTYWCTADPGWVTGTVYGIFGPWFLGTTLISYEGRFDAKIWYGILERYGVTVWYTAPTALRMLMRAGDDVVKEFDFSRLRHICSVGEPLNAEVVRWAMKVYGKRIHDTWWQTETGAQLICNYPSMTIKPGSMGKPIPGVIAAVVDEEGNEVPPKKEGFLALRPGWPSMMIGIWRNTPKFKEYFRIPGWYIAGDQAYKDEEGYFWFLGRADDVIKTSGERLGPFEVESALIEHPAVAEAGVIGKPDELRGEIVKAFISLRPGHHPSDKLKEEITNFVKTRLAYYAYPREIEFVDSLPKTRSGKIMRRVLKAKELGQPLGDLSTLEE
ncbi:acetate--CoA ligase [Methanomassiliicoccus luminyensis]|uniref:acetate--CoA ligase n=1 Tax=Methanomassiliicoccus luminyensis TaxID=1080712 RepID=UPI0003604DF4|nr:acetate--CoA ligase [Methanomassiliicoccus luminyensis]